MSVVGRRVTVHRTVIAERGRRLLGAARRRRRPIHDEPAVVGRRRHFRHSADGRQPPRRPTAGPMVPVTTAVDRRCAR